MLLIFPHELRLHTRPGRDPGGLSRNVKVLLFNLTSEGNSGQGMQAMETICLCLGQLSVTQSVIQFITF